MRSVVWGISGLNHNLKILGDKLRRDGLARRDFLLMAYDSIWIAPELPYRDILEVYADYVNDAPERVHATLCYYLLAAGREIGPEQYFKELKMEVERENRVSTQEGSGACAGCADTREPTRYAGSTGNRSQDW